MTGGPILVINTGSSSLKLGVYVREDGEERVNFTGLADGIGRAEGKLEVRDVGGQVVRSETMSAPTQESALLRAALWFGELSPEPPRAIGHRIVHGGPRLTQHQVITPELLQTLEKAIHFAPLHIPPALDLIRAARRAYCEVPQIACFDTAFHSTMPEVASRFPLPRGLFDHGIRRYGFHGLSYESIVHQLGAELSARTVVAHLGSGASLAALERGVSVDTSMGLTPTGGIPMGTRSGDLDPGVLLYLMRAQRMDADRLETLLNKESGLLGLSGGKSDMRDLQAAAAGGDGAARMAIEVFCRSISKRVAGYAAVLRGLDLLVFTGGIGERSSEVRRNVCEVLRFLGMELDEGANSRSEAVISSTSSAVRIRVVASDEDGQIARHCRDILSRISA